MSKKSIDELKPGVDYFADIHDLLGTMDPTWSPRKVKELLRSMIESGIIYSWSEARLYRFLLSRGLLNNSANLKILVITSEQAIKFHFNCPVNCL